MFLKLKNMKIRKDLKHQVQAIKISQEKQKNKIK